MEDVLDPVEGGSSRAARRWHQRKLRLAENGGGRGRRPSRRPRGARKLFDAAQDADGAAEAAARPGYLVLPKSYLTPDTMPTGLPGTELEFCLPRQVAIMDDPFCPPLAEVLR